MKVLTTFTTRIKNKLKINASENLDGIIHVLYYSDVLLTFKNNGVKTQSADSSR